MTPIGTARNAELCCVLNNNYHQEHASVVILQGFTLNQVLQRIAILQHKITLYRLYSVYLRHMGYIFVIIGISFYFAVVL